MKKISKFIIDKYKLVLLFFLILTIFSGVLTLFLNINFSLAKYMPSDSKSMKALSEMREQYDEPIPNLRIALKDISIPEVLNYKEKLKEISEVKLVLWIDDLSNSILPVNILEKEIRDSFYKDNNALLQVSVDTNNAKKSINKIKAILPNTASYEGDIVSQASAQKSVTSEITTITAFAVPIGLLILMLAVKSWIEPILLMACIGIAILINMGTNVFLGEVSFVTQSVSSILQLAVSLDYAIFLLHEFREQKKLTDDSNEALKKSIEVSSSAVISSALTTVFGFIVLVAMKFGIGKDLGLVLAKGIFFSLLSVIFLLPALIKLTIKLIDRTEHKDFLPNFKPLSKYILELRWLILIVVIFIPVAFIGQLKNDFTYGMGAYEDGSKEQRDKEYIESVFGKSTQLVIMVPKDNLVKEHIMINELKKEPLVVSVQSYTERVGLEIPPEIAPTEAIKSLISEKYSRVILNTSSDTEGDSAFSFVNRVRDIASKYCGNNYRLLGESVVLEDMSKIIKFDNLVVNILAILSVALVILINFKSISIPLILVLTIEASIWINLSIPYFTNTKLSFIGYLVISSIQLGATVDYAILYTNEYIKQRRIKTKKEAIIESGTKVYGSIIPPALILISAGIILSIVSSISLVSELGTVLGRGAFLSLILVMLLLPILLYFFDSIIEKTTLKTKFMKG